MRIEFLATLPDIERGLSAAEKELGELRYLELGTKRVPAFAVFNSFSALPNLGMSSSTAAGMGGAFEICRASEIELHPGTPLGRETAPSTGVFVSDFPHRSGSIYFAPSFRYSKDPQKLVPGVFSDGDTDESRLFFRGFRKAFLRGFEKHWVWHIGPEALRSARSGTTLIAMDVNERPDQHVQIN